jgi:hypothetical protein
MWQALRDIITSAKESLGIEVPDVGAVTDVVTGAGEQADDAATTATDAASSAATDAADTAAGAAGAAGEAAAEAGEQLTSKVADFLGRLGG